MGLHDGGMDAADHTLHSVHVPFRTGVCERFEMPQILVVQLESEHLQVIFQMAGIERERGNAEAADVWLTRLREEYRWSPLNK